MKQKRPLIITIICIIAFIGAGLGILTPLMNYLPSEILKSLDISIPAWYFWISSILSITIIYAFILIWKMKKYGVHLYIGLTILNYLLGSYIGLADIYNFMIPIIFILILLYQLKKMN